ncbi:MAG: hypothetical protein J5496_09260 [Lachnospiraceae bacterium]|nr:hypothetical protein [Lachnospiraceae bacterium]
MANIIWQPIFWLLLIAVLILLPGFILQLKAERDYAPDKIGFEVTDIVRDSKTGAAQIKTVIRNEGKLSFDRLQGDLEIYQGDRLLYSVICSYTGQVAAGAEKKVTFTEDDLSKAEVLLSVPVRQLRYTWTPSSARYARNGLLFTRFFENESLVHWIIVAWPIAAVCTLAAGILALKSRKQEKESESAESLAAEHSCSNRGYSVRSSYYSGGGESSSSGASSSGASSSGSTYSYGSGGSWAGSAASYSGAADSHAAKAADESPHEKKPAVDEEKLRSAQRRLENASWMESSYRSQNLTQNAELQDHLKRTAFGQVLRESSGLSGKDLEAFDSARKTYENASWMESNYRTSGPMQKQNAEHAQHRRESAYAGMLKAVAEKDGRHSSDFDSAKRSYERESFLASSYRASGSAENAAEAEHRQRLAYANMLKNSSDLDRSASWDFSSAQRSYESASRSAASYRRQGLTRDAERAEHQMRVAEANMLKVKAEMKGNGSEFADAKKDFENASRRYSEYKASGRDADANREKDYMERARAKMMQYL